jgi:hypothetical protein
LRRVGVAVADLLARGIGSLKSRLRRSAKTAQYGKETIEKVRREKPHVYLQVVASLLPRQVQMEKLNPFSDISDEELQMMEELLTASRAKLVPELEQNGAADSGTNNR